MVFEGAPIVDTRMLSLEGFCNVAGSDDVMDGLVSPLSTVSRHDVEESSLLEVSEGVTVRCWAEFSL